MNDIEQFYPLSPLQEGMLFDCLYDPQSDVYVDQLSCRVEGDLDAAAFRRVWESVVARHAVLRTAFVWEQLAEPLQIVRRGVSLPWEEADWQTWSADAQRDALAAYRARTRRLPLNQAPILRLGLHRLGPARWQFTWTWHHLLLDGWSMALLMEEVLAGYEAYRAGREPAWATRRPYRDYIVWLRRQDLTAAEAYWRNALVGVTATVVDLGGGARQPGFGVVDVVVSEEETRALTAAAREQQVTLNTVVQGAWALVMSRCSGTRDVVYGAVVSGRPPGLPGVDAMLGLFINTLPVRVRVDGSARVDQWLRALQAEQAEARQYEFTPLVRVQGWSEIPRGTPLFTTLVAFQNYPEVGNANAGGGTGERSVSVTGFELQDDTSYGLTVSAIPGPRLRLRAGYDGSKYDRSAVARLLGHWRQTLAALAANPTGRVGTIPLLSGEEQGALLAMGAGAAAAAAPAIVERVGEEAGRRPDGMAATDDGGRHWTYGALDACAQQGARALRQAGVGPETPVGVCLTRTADMLVTLVAVWQAGGVVVPLDPTAPAARLAWLCEDAGVRLVVSDAAARANLPRACRVLERAPRAAAAGAAPRAPRAPGGELAYVIYTSGSTGQPKGVGVSHAALSAVLAAAHAEVPLGPDDMGACLASLAFDIAFWELLLPWMGGGTTRVVAREVVQDARALVAALPAVTVLHGVPSVWRAVVAALPPGAVRPAWCRQVRVVCVGGDRVGSGLLTALRTTFPQAQVRVLYGPTETTIISASGVAAGPEAEDGLIGGPLAGTTLRVVDRGGALVPVGVVGELWVGGVGVARGYVGQPALTAARFVPDAWSATPGARVYRTGDLVRWTRPGRLAFVGRRDAQVKVRGYRVEVGEIERVLEQHPAVAAAAVAAPVGADGERYLVGYVVWQAAAAGVDALRAYAAARLPGHLVPGVLVPVPALPVTANGKVDRAALPAPPAAGAAGAAAPRTVVEEVLAAIWGEVLQVPRVGVEDNFFQLGGHSLLATQVLWRVREACQVDLPLRTLFEQPTIAALAGAIERHLLDRATEEDVAALLAEVLEMDDEAVSAILE